MQWTTFLARIGCFSFFFIRLIVVEWFYFFLICGESWDGNWQLWSDPPPKIKKQKNNSKKTKLGGGIYYCGHDIRTHESQAPVPVTLSAFCQLSVVPQQCPIHWSFLFFLSSVRIVRPRDAPGCLAPEDPWKRSSISMTTVTRPTIATTSSILG